MRQSHHMRRRAPRNERNTIFPPLPTKSSCQNKGKNQCRCRPPTTTTRGEQNAKRVLFARPDKRREIVGKELHALTVKSISLSQALKCKGALFKDMVKLIIFMFRFTYVLILLCCRIGNWKLGWNQIAYS